MVTTQGNCVTFRLLRPEARRVLLVGDFNDWGARPLPMVRVNDGSWLAAVRLATGTYRFGYVIDGLPYPDHAAFQAELGPDGPEGVVKVSPRPDDPGRPAGGPDRRLVA